MFCSCYEQTILLGGLNDITKCVNYHLRHVVLQYECLILYITCCDKTAEQQVLAALQVSGHNLMQAYIPSAA